MNLNRDYILNLAKEILLIPSPSGYTKEISKMGGISLWT